MIQRIREKNKLEKLFQVFPAIALLGPRQCGKTTLAQQFSANHVFDLENPRDLARLSNPQLALENLTGLIIIDEVQRKPDLFPVLRYLIDHKKNQQFLLLGSASRELIQQSSESLAGRIAYFELNGFTLHDISENEFQGLWLKGGFPLSFLKNEQESFIWREQYIQTFLERDLPQLGIHIPSTTMLRFWKMLSHYHGQILNYSELARSLDVSDTSIRRYLDILASTFMIRLQQPWFFNSKKRLVKNPKLYIRDSGIFHSLQTIASWDELQTNPKLGASFEGFAVEAIAREWELRNEELYFWKVHSGAELDVFFQKHGKKYGVEIKYSDAPQNTKSMHTAIAELGLEKLFVIYPGDTNYQLSENIEVLSLRQITGTILT